MLVDNGDAILGLFDHAAQAQLTATQPAKDGNFRALQLKRRLKNYDIYMVRKHYIVERLESQNAFYNTQALTVAQKWFILCKSYFF